MKINGQNGNLNLLEQKPRVQLLLESQSQTLSFYSRVARAMGYLSDFWNKLTYTKSLEEANGKLESLFFGKVYRVWYITGLSSVDDSVPYMVYKNTIKLALGLMFLGEIWFALSEASGLDVIAGSLNIIIIQFIMFFRYWNMINNKDMYRNLAMSMESVYFDISTTERRQLVDYWAKINEKYLKGLLILGNYTLACWFLYPLLDEYDYNMFIPIKLPFYYQSPWRYGVSYTCLFIAFLYISHIVMVNDLMMQAHLLNLVCQFDVLGNCFENVIKDCQIQFPGVSLEKMIQSERFQRAYRNRMADLVQQHRNILRHVMDLRGTLSNPMLGQLIGSGIMICFVGYHAATTVTENLTQGLTSLCFLGYNLFVFFIICRWCEEITIKGQRIGESVYFSHWECGVSKYPGVKATLMLIIARANKPVIFTAGGMYNISLESYASLVKTSYSALTVLLRFRQN